jgi:diamine N-acetyltransferase
VTVLLRTSGLRLREGAREDLVLLRDLIAAAPASMASPGLAGQVARAPLEQLLQVSKASPDHLLLVLEEKGSGGPVGLLQVRLRHPWPRAAFIELLLLVPAARGRGYGRQACEALHDWARIERRLLEVQAAVLAEDVRALAFWRALGYRETGETRKDDGGRSYRILCLKLA